MNFVCDNCKAIRPFCGEPPKCGVCGWERNAPSHQEANVLPGEPAQVGAGEQKAGLGVLLRVGIWGIVLVGAVFVIVQFLSLGKHSDFQTPGKYRLALKYGLTEDEVFMDLKTAGCDFLGGPPGGKDYYFWA